MRRKLRENLRRNFDYIRPPADLAGPDEVWEDAFERSLLLVLLDVVRREADPRDYLAFELYVLKDMKAAEVARVTGLTPRAVYRVHRKLLDRLRQLAGDYDDHGTLTPRLREAVRLEVDRAGNPSRADQCTAGGVGKDASWALRPTETEADPVGPAPRRRQPSRRSRRLW